MRNQFDLELHELEQSFLGLGQLVLETASKTLLALASKDKEMAELIINKDHAINQGQSAIELTCARLLALQQPQVSDLRFVISIMSSCSDLERMGDHMAGIAKAVLQLKENQLALTKNSYTKWVNYPSACYPIYWLPFLCTKPQKLLVLLKKMNRLTNIIMPYQRKSLDL